jgi:hypothetical protein
MSCGRAPRRIISWSSLTLSLKTDHGHGLRLAGHDLGNLGLEGRSSRVVEQFSGHGAACSAEVLDHGVLQALTVGILASDNGHRLDTVVDRVGRDDSALEHVRR